jgi:WD40 repeat protein
MPRAPVDVAGTMPQLAVHAVCVAAGAVIATYGDGMVRRWDVDRGVVLAEARIGTFGWDACALGDRVAIAGDDGTLHVLDARTLAPIDRVQGLAVADGAPYLVGVALVGADLVVAGASRGLAVLDPDTLAVRGELRGETAPPRALAVVPDAPWLLVADRDGAVALWDVAARRLLRNATPPGGAVSVAALPSIRGRAPLVGTRDGMVMRLALSHLEPERVAAVHAGAVNALLALPDGRALTGGADRAVRLVDLDVAAASRPAHAGAVTALAVTTHPRLAVVTGGADGTVKLWDARGRSLRTIPTGARVASVAIASDGPDLLLYSPGLVHRIRPDGTVTSTPGDSPPPPPPVPELAATVDRGDVVTITRRGAVVGRWSCDATPQAFAFADDKTLVLGDAAGEVTLLALE